jgi:hypothetical protein
LEEKTGQEKLNTQLVKELGCDTKWVWLQGSCSCHFISRVKKD